MAVEGERDQRECVNRTPLREPARTTVSAPLTPISCRRSFAAFTYSVTYMSRVLIGHCFLLLRPSTKHQHPVFHPTPILIQPLVLSPSWVVLLSLPARPDTSGLDLALSHFAGPAPMSTTTRNGSAGGCPKPASITRSITIRRRFQSTVSYGRNVKWDTPLVMI